MDTWDYKLDERDYTTDNNELLADNGMPITSFPSTQTRCLAAIASAIHLNSAYISEAQIEQSIGWLKRAKARRIGPYANQEYGGFCRALEALKTTPEQVAMQKKAAWKAIKSNLAAVGLFLSACTALLLYSIDVSKWWSLIPFLIAAALFDTMQKLTKESLIIAKDQDRRYFMASIRLAASVGELNEAGFFMHIDKNDDEDSYVKAARSEIARMRDVIYTKSNLDYDGPEYV